VIKAPKLKFIKKFKAGVLYQLFLHYCTLKGISSYNYIICFQVCNIFLVDVWKHLHGLKPQPFKLILTTITNLSKSIH